MQRERDRRARTTLRDENARQKVRQRDKEQEGVEARGCARRGGALDFLGRGGSSGRERCSGADLAHQIHHPRNAERVERQHAELRLHIAEVQKRYSGPRGRFGAALERWGPTL